MTIFPFVNTKAKEVASAHADMSSQERTCIVLCVVV